MQVGQTAQQVPLLRSCGAMANLHSTVKTVPHPVPRDVINCTEKRKHADNPKFAVALLIGSSLELLDEAVMTRVLTLSAHIQNDLGGVAELVVVAEGTDNLEYLNKELARVCRKSHVQSHNNKHTTAHQPTFRSKNSTIAKTFVNTWSIPLRFSDTNWAPLSQLGPGVETY